MSGRHGAGRDGALLRQQSASDQHLHPRIAARPHLRTAQLLHNQIQDFVNLRVNNDPELNGVTVRYLGGEAGLYAAANDVLYRLDLINITFVLAAIFIFCAVSFRSAVAGALFIVSCVMANFGAFVYMGRARHRTHRRHNPDHLARHRAGRRLWHLHRRAS